MTETPRPPVLLTIKPAVFKAADNWSEDCGTSGQAPEELLISLLVDEVRAQSAALQEARADLDALRNAGEQVASWLRSFSMPPTATIAEKDEHLALLENAFKEPSR